MNPRSALEPGAWWENVLNPKGNLSRAALLLLSLAAVVPLLMVAVRVTAMPGVVSPELTGPGLDFVRSLGSTLNQFLSLEAVPPYRRTAVLYVLFLPLCALLISLSDSGRS
jgi:hypothetical protein